MKKIIVLAGAIGVIGFSVYFAMRPKPLILQGVPDTTEAKVPFSVPVTTDKGIVPDTTEAKVPFSVPVTADKGIVPDTTEAKISSSVPVTADKSIVPDTTEAKIPSSVPGRVDAIYREEGDSVNEEELLISPDAPDLRAQAVQVDIAQRMAGAQQQKAQAKYDASKKDTHAAEAPYNMAQQGTRTEDIQAADDLEERKAEAALYMEGADYQAAYKTYAALLWDYPDDDGVTLGIIRSATRIGRYYPALMALERLSVKYPRDMEIRKELLMVYLQVNDTASARREAEILRQNNSDLEGIDLDALLSSSLSFLYTGRLAVGLLYDSNANAGLSSNEILPGLFLLNAEKTASPGAYLQGTVNGSWHLTERWGLVGDLNAYYRYNTDSDLLNNTNILWLRGAAGIRYAASRFLTDVRLKTEFTQQGSDIDDDQKIVAYGLDGSFTYGLRPTLMLTTRLSADRRNYNKGEEREGLYWSAGEYFRVLFGNKTYDLTLGLRLHGSSTDVSSHDYLGWEASARMLVAIKSFEITPSFAYRQDSYNGKSSFLDTENREDTQIRAGMSGLWRFHRDWSTELMYQYTKNDSTSLLYDYDQHLITMSVAVFF